MLELFAKLYEWFGLIPFYTKDLGDHLRGFDITCSEYIGTALYLYVGWIMVALTAVFYVLQYHVINSSRFNKRTHWWITTLVISAINFLIAFTLPFNDLQNGDFCGQLRFGVRDCVGFGISNAVWSFIIFALLTSTPYPRLLSGHNTRYTTFWKPKS